MIFYDILYGVVSGYTLYLDAANPLSYPGTGTVWYDLSSQQLDATIYGATYSVDSSGVFNFDGVNDYIRTTAASTTLSSYTVSFWAKRYVENRMAFSSQSTSNIGFYWYGDNSWRYIHGGVGGEKYYDKPTSIPLNTWGNYCVTYDGSEIIIYRQGVYQDQSPTTGTAVFNIIDIGRWSSYSDIDIIRIGNDSHNLKFNMTS